MLANNFGGPLVMNAMGYNSAQGGGTRQSGRYLSRVSPPLPPQARQEALESFTNAATLTLSGIGVGLALLPEPITTGLGLTINYRGAETHPLRLFDATGMVRFSGP